MLVPGMRVCLVVGSHVAALGFRRREECGCHDLRGLVRVQDCKCKDRDGWSRLAGGASGWSEIDG